MPADSIIWVDAVDPATAMAVAGSKIGRLAELHRDGVRVPKGFAVMVGAYRTHCAESGLDDRIGEVIARLGWAKRTSQHPWWAAASATIRDLFETTPISATLTAEIIDAYEELCFAVRRCQCAHRGALVGHR